MTLKMYGTLTASEIGRRLGISGEAARQQLVRLAESGMVAEERRAAGRGRPASYFQLTGKGQANFPDTHAALTVEILASVRDVFGPEALDRIIAKREQGTEELYRRELASFQSLRERVDRLAELRSAEGYMATTEAAGEGDILLIENHCPICAAASFCQGFCRSELAVFQRVLGPQVEIERVEHVVGGGRRCSYLIREAI
ncbi:helix-turn-helix transcriptional regulator [Acidimangrovimonas sediminis]|uniref:helix-turn-helix transcriptional regulator n=1 Tax=Acidimangrovimonas sediminis TaxID=2056283 RepID=UPI000C804307|nr:metalloregulator ArsR/SmtB family transcription factor [Acidimangrovimonas sediminis]